MSGSPRRTSTRRALTAWAGSAPSIVWASERRYSRALSISRRANFRVNITPSTLEITESTFNDAVAGRVYRMQGDASVEYQFRRTWRASGTVQRGVDYLAVLAEPIFSDAGRFSLEGLLTRRIDLLATAGYATGASVVNRSSQLDTYTGNVRLRFALTRTLAFYSEYLYIHYDQRGQLLAPEIPRAFEQHGVRIGLTLWASVSMSTCRRRPAGVIQIVHA